MHTWGFILDCEWIYDSALTPNPSPQEECWPTSGKTQTFRDVDVNQFIELTEFSTDYRKREMKNLQGFRRLHPWLPSIAPIGAFEYGMPVQCFQPC